jgi:hypothetical protein
MGLSIRMGEPLGNASVFVCIGNVTIGRKSTGMKIGMGMVVARRFWGFKSIERQGLSF